MNENWLLKQLVGGTLVLCGECREWEDKKDRDEKYRQFIIDVRIAAYRSELEQEITIEKIRESEENSIEVVECANLEDLKNKMQNDNKKPIE